MLENEEEIQKLKDLLKKRVPNLSGNELEKIAQELFSLGLFLVRLKIKEHSKPPPKEEGFNDIKREPP